MSETSIHISESLNGKSKKNGTHGSNQSMTEERFLDYAGQVAAISKSQAVIEFELDGTIINANENFLGAVGYSLSEIQGKHHRMFCEDSLVTSPQYRKFWEDLASGKYQAGEFKRFGKNGKEIWIQASYNPILGPDGTPFKIVKYASDITDQKLKTADYQGQLAAIGKSQAVIEFELDGTIINANENFLKTVGYSLSEIQGKHHSMFADPEYSKSAAYKEFWAKLARGQYDSGEYKRIGKNGKEIWIQASYNPILTADGRPFKVVKYATDITEQKLKNADYQGQLAAISKSQAVIEFELDGTIKNANDNFLNTLGYSLSEIQGKHHSMFVEEKDRTSSQYKEFWAKLRRGEYDAGEYKRLGKNGKEVWIYASYNPIMNADGKPFKVVKYASDITNQIKTRMEIAKTATDLAASSEELTSVSTQISSNAEKTSQQSNTASAASEQVSKNVQTVATASEQMGASISEIAKSANESARVATSAVSMAKSTNDIVAKLGVSSAEIGKVVKVITSIAEQTNLLALNATIEAARAGEAGKGFAVVANEVKELAKETAKATEEISNKIGAIQSDTQGAVVAIGDISSIINKINDLSSTIASAVEEQTATTSEIARNVTEAAKGSADIAHNIANVSAGARITTEGAAHAQTAALELAKMAARLQELADQSGK